MKKIIYHEGHEIHEELPKNLFDYAFVSFVFFVFFVV